MARFDTTELLGLGATGEVYKAVDTGSGSLVALKRPPQGTAAPDLARYRAAYRQEAAILQRVAHPSCLRLIEQGDDEGIPFIAYEYLRGQPLRALIAAGRKFTPAELPGIANPLLDALEYLHATGIVHRDVNPNNLLLVHDEQGVSTGLRLIDFGASALLEGAEPGPLIGTPQYMAPEQLGGAPPDPRADLFSAAVVCYELLTGRPPFTGNSFPEVLQVIQQGQFTPATRLDPALPAGLDGFFATALATDPMRRFQAAKAMRNALSHVLGGGTVPIALTPKTSPPQAAPRTEETPASEGARFVATEGAYQGTAFPLPGGITTLGGNFADINLARDLAIAPQHCWAVYEAEQYWLYDADNSGGTQLNGQWIKRAPLLHGDVIAIGGSRFRFEDPTQPAGAARARGSVEYADPPAGAAPGPPAPAAEKPHKSAAPRPMPHASRFAPVVLTLLFALAVGWYVAAVVIPNQIREEMSKELELVWADLNPIINARDEGAFLDLLRAHNWDVSAAVLGSPAPPEPAPDPSLPPPPEPELPIEPIQPRTPAALAWFPAVQAATNEARAMREYTRDLLETFRTVAADDGTLRRLSPAQVITLNQAQLGLDGYAFETTTWALRKVKVQAFFKQLLAGVTVPATTDLHPIVSFLADFRAGMESYANRDFTAAFNQLDVALVGMDRWYAPASKAERDEVIPMGPASAGNVAEVVMAICEIRQAQIRVNDAPRPEYSTAELKRMQSWVRDAGRLLRGVRPEELAKILDALAVKLPMGTNHQTFETEMDLVDDRLDEWMNQSRYSGGITNVVPIGPIGPMNEGE